MGCCYPPDRRIEFGEGFLDNKRGNICGGAAPWVVFVNNHEAMRLSDRRENRFLGYCLSRWWIIQPSLLLACQSPVTLFILPEYSSH